MKKLSLLVPLFLVLAGCPKPLYVEVYNNTAGEIWIVIPDAKSTFLKSGEKKKLPQNRVLYHPDSDRQRFPAVIWISDEVRQWEYNLTPELLKKVWPRPDAMTRIQIQSGEEIVVLDSGSQYSAYQVPAGLTLRGRRNLP